MEIIKNFGIEPILLGAQIINFLIILFLLKKFMYKPVMKMLEERKRNVLAGLKQAEEGKKMLEDATIKQKQILKAAQTQASKIVDDAKEKATEIAKDSENLIKKQTEKMLQDAQIQIEEEIKIAKQNLSDHVSSLAIDFVKFSLKDLFNEKDQEAIMIRAIKELKQKSSN